MARHSSRLAFTVALIVTFSLSVPSVVAQEGGVQFSETCSQLSTPGRSDRQLERAARASTALRRKANRGLRALSSCLGRKRIQRLRARLNESHREHAAALRTAGADQLVCPYSTCYRLPKGFTKRELTRSARPFRRALKKIERVSSGKCDIAIELTNDLAAQVREFKPAPTFYCVDPTKGGGLRIPRSSVPLFGLQDKDQDGLSGVSEFILGTSDENRDSDGDGTLDSKEDSDGDGVTDDIEMASGLDALNGTSPLDAGSADNDSDGFSVALETVFGTSDTLLDTDTDGAIDPIDEAGISQEEIASVRVHGVAPPGSSIEVLVGDLAGGDNEEIANFRSGTAQSVGKVVSDANGFWEVNVDATNRLQEGIVPVRVDIARAEAPQVSTTYFRLFAFLKPDDEVENTSTITTTASLPVEDPTEVFSSRPDGFISNTIELDNGGFAQVSTLNDTLTAIERGADGSQDVYLHLYDDLTAPITSVIMNATVDQTQDRPSVTQLSNGTIAAVWRTFGTASDGMGTAIRGRLFDTDGGPLDLPFLVNDQTTGNQDFPSITSLADGGFAVTWQTSAPGTTEIALKVYSADGTARIMETIISDPGGNSGLIPYLDQLSTGDLAIGWRETESGRQNGWFRVVGLDGLPVSEATPVAELSPVCGARWVESVFAFDDGNFILRLNDLLADTDRMAEPGFAHRRGAVGVIADSSGEIVTPLFPILEHPYQVQTTHGHLVNQPPSDLLRVGVRHFTPTSSSSVVYEQLMASDGTGTEHERDLPTVAPLFVERDGSTPFTVSGNTTAARSVSLRDAASLQTVASTVSDGAGDYSLSFTSNQIGAEPGDTSLQVVVTDASGNSSVVDEQPITVFSADQANTEQLFTLTENDCANADQLPYAVRFLNNGGTATIYEGSLDEGDRGVFLQTAAIPGFLLEAPTTVAQSTTGDQQNANMAVLTSGNIVVVWESQHVSPVAVFARIFDANGAPLTNEFLIDDPGEKGVQPDVLSDDNGGFSVFWVRNNNDLAARAFDGMGAAQGLPVVISTNTTRSKGVPSAARNSNGDYLVAWHLSNEDANPGRGIAARLVDSTFTPLTAEFFANGTVIGDQAFPQVATNGDGFIVGWQSDNDTGGPFSIQTRRVQSDGTLVDTNDFIVTDDVNPFGRNPFTILYFTDGSSEFAFRTNTVTYPQLNATNRVRFDAEFNETIAPEEITEVRWQSRRGVVADKRTDGGTVYGMGSGRSSVGGGGILLTIYGPDGEKEVTDYTE